jgi:hypothetical protein
MTEAAFYKYCENVQGMLPEDAKAEWKKLADNPLIDRDNDGWLGQELRTKCQNMLYK